MNLILGMDLGVFLAWIGTLLASLLCILYGVYYQFVKKSGEQHKINAPDIQEKKHTEDE